MRLLFKIKCALMMIHPTPGCAEYLGLESEGLIAHFLVNTDLNFFGFEEIPWSVHVRYA